MAGPVRPTSGHMARYRTPVDAAAHDDRLQSTTFERNCPPIIATLSPWLRSRAGAVLEIGSGTGQHAGAFALAFPNLDWWPSDPDKLHRTSISAWRSKLALPTRDPLNIDAASDWAQLSAIRQLGPLSAVISLNVIHISAFDVTRGIIAGAAQTLEPNGLLIFYGPFCENGAHTGPGNAAFDAGLRAENPQWGVRDTDEISDLAKNSGLDFAALEIMPAGNRLLIFRKR